jgi:hypothetical protein
MIEKAQQFTVRQREVFAELLASARDRKESELDSARDEAERIFIQKLANEKVAAQLLEAIKAATETESAARKAYEDSQSELEKTTEELERVGFEVDSSGIFSLDRGAPKSVKNALDAYMRKLTSENQQKLHEYDVATLNVWAAKTAEEAKRFVEGLV